MWREIVDIGYMCISRHVTTSTYLWDTQVSSIVKKKITEISRSILHNSLDQSRHPLVFSNVTFIESLTTRNSVVWDPSLYPCGSCPWNPGSDLMGLILLAIISFQSPKYISHLRCPWGLTSQLYGKKKNVWEKCMEDVHIWIWEVFRFAQAFAFFMSRLSETLLSGIVTTLYTPTHMQSFHI